MTISNAVTTGPTAREEYAQRVPGTTSSSSVLCFARVTFVTGVPFEAQALPDTRQATAVTTTHCTGDRICCTPLHHQWAVLGTALPDRAATVIATGTSRDAITSRECCGKLGCRGARLTQLTDSKTLVGLGDNATLLAVLLYSELLTRNDAQKSQRIGQCCVIPVSRAISGAVP